MDDLSIALTDAKIGCNINGTFINHLLYAEDTCSIAPCPTALQKLLDICSAYAVSHTITFNVKKTMCMCMCFKPCNLNVIISFSKTVCNDIAKPKFF